jgi:hypothetical protein
MGTKFMDQYSLLHLASGIIVRYWNLSLLGWIVVHTLFEWLENTKSGMRFINTYIKIWPGGKPEADSITNSIGDTFFSLLGWFLAHSMFISY